MLKKLAIVSASVLMASAVASGASAHVATGTYTLGTPGAQTLAVQHSISLSCEASLTLNVTGPHAGNISAGSLSPGSDQCSNVELRNFNWPVTIGNFSTNAAGAKTATFQVTNVGAKTLLGTCTGGVLSGTISQAAAAGSPVIVSITSSSGWTSSPLPFLGCGVTGTMTMSPTPAISVP